MRKYGIYLVFINIFIVFLFFSVPLFLSFSIGALCT